MNQYQHCYATPRNDVGKIATPFRIRLNPNAKLRTQRPTKVPIHYREKLFKNPNELENHGNIRQIGFSPSDESIHGTIFNNPLLIIPQGDPIKVDLAASHSNSNTDQSSEYWPIEPLAPQLAIANQNSSLELTSCTLVHMPL